MNQVTEFVQPQSGVSPQERTRLNQLGDQLRKRLAAFFRMRCQAEEDLNPFADQGKTPSLLLCYVLWCIDELPSSEAAHLWKLTPRMRIEYDQDGEWQDIVASVMRLNDDWPRQIRRGWEWNSEIARSRGLLLTPRQFAEQVIEANLETLSLFGSTFSHSYQAPTHRRS